MSTANEQAGRLLALALDTFKNGEAGDDLAYIERLVSKAADLIKNEGASE
jgi:hypothetical protein